MRVAGIVAVAFLLSTGCMPYPVKMAYRQAEVFCKQEGANGNEKAAAIGNGLAAANHYTGADSIPDNEVDIDPPAVKANTDKIGKAQAVKDAAKGFLGNLLDELGKRWPLFCGAAGLSLALWKAISERKAQSAVTGLAHAGMDIRDKIKAGEVLTEDGVKSIFAFWNEAKGARPLVESILATVKAAWKPTVKES